MPAPNVVVIGAGLAGLACARSLTESGATVVLLELEDRPGGRVKTDRVDGFLLDRGFQVFLPSYPAARSVLDYAELDLRPFMRGALVRSAGRFESLIDPLSHPVAGLAGLFTRSIPLTDQLRMLRMRTALSRTDESAIMFDEERPARSDLLDVWGFTEKALESFWRPFIAGITLDSSLTSSSRFVRFVLSMFAGQGAALPAEGMERIPAQIAASLRPGALRTGVGAERLEAGHVICTNGEVLRCDATVVAANAHAAARLLPTLEVPDSHAVFCYYFSAHKAPLSQPVLVLNGERSGPINNLAVVSNVAPEYAPDGKALISVTALEEESGPDLDRRVAKQLRSWFGADVDEWECLRSYRIDAALPSAEAIATRDPRHVPGVYVCGDYCDTPSINGAIASGLRAARSVLEDAS